MQVLSHLNLQRSTPKINVNAANRLVAFQRLLFECLDKMAEDPLMGESEGGRESLDADGVVLEVQVLVFELMLAGVAGAGVVKLLGVDHLRQLKFQLFVLFSSEWMEGVGGVSDSHLPHSQQIQTPCTAESWRAMSRLVEHFLSANVMTKTPGAFADLQLLHLQRLVLFLFEKWQRHHPSSPTHRNAFSKLLRHFLLIETRVVQPHLELLWAFLASSVTISTISHCRFGV